MFSISTKIGREKLDLSAAVSNRATVRLMKDLQQIIRNPLCNISARPVERNIFVWHCNLKGPVGTPWEGGIFHMVLNFPSTYPDQPPSVELKTRIEHPNVFGNKICLDLLNVRKPGKKVELYSGWSSSYTIQTILIQLQAFLFEAEVSNVLANISDPKQYEKEKKRWYSAVKWSVEQSRSYKDKSVNHFPPNQIWPPFPDEEQIEEEKKREAQIEEELVCFYSRKSFKEDCLGIGVSFSKDLRTGEIKRIKACLDLFGLSAFMNHNLRLGAMNETFTHFLPVFLNAEHGEKAIYLSKRALSIIMTGNHKNFTPEMVLSVYPKLMSQMVLTVVTEKRALSTKFLQGYCYFHRILLHFQSEFPELNKMIDATVQGFLKDENQRHKDVIPALGDFISYAAVADVEWKDFVNIFLDEVFVRNVYWILAKYPELEHLEHEEFNDEDRMNFSFKVVLNSLRLVLFHKFFFNEIAHRGKKTKKEICEEYDANYGKVSEAIEEKFLDFCKKVMEIRTFEEFFEMLEIPITKEEIIKKLKDSIAISKKKKYHGVDLKIMSALEFVKESEKGISLEKICTGEDKDGNPILLEDEKMFQQQCEMLWGFKELPDYLKNATALSNKWRKLFLQQKVQDTVHKLNEVMDFKNFHRILDIAREITHLEITMFSPSNLKSRYFFLTVIIAKLENLNTLIIRKGDDGLGLKGFKALLKGLAKNPGKLENLHLDYCNLDSNSIKELTKGTLVSSNLKKLSLRGNFLHDAGAVALSKFLIHHENFKNLNYLDLSDCKICNSGAIALAEALIVKRQLKTLLIFNNNITTGISTLLKNLSYSTAIEEIDFSRIKTPSFQSNGMDLGKILQLTLTLKKLNFWATPMHISWSSGVFGYLRLNKTLKELDLGKTRFSAMSQLGRALSRNKTLEKLILHENGINGTQLFQFYEEIIKPPPRPEEDDYEPCLSLKYLDISHSSLSVVSKKKHNKVIGMLIKVAPRLEELNLNHCSLSRVNLEEEFCEALKTTKSLKKILLRKNSIGKQGLKDCLEGFIQNKTITEIDLSGNDLGVIGGGYIAQIIEKNETIKDLNIFGNFVEIEGGQAIAKALIQNKVIERLDIGLNRIRNRGGLSFVEVFEKNNTLKGILLKHNHISDKCAINLMKTIISNPKTSLEEIYFNGNFLTIGIQQDMSVQFKKRFKDKFFFDLSKRVENKCDTEKIIRTVYVTPLPKNIDEQQIKKFFYEHKCGYINNVSIYEHKIKKDYNKRKYAFVEFGDSQSVLLALRLVYNGKNMFSGQKISILKAGVENVKKGGKAKGKNKRGH